MECISVQEKNVLLSQETRWINIENGFPDRKEPVFMIHNEHGIIYGFLSQDLLKFKNFKVTHWTYMTESERESLKNGGFLK